MDNKNIKANANGRHGVVLTDTHVLHFNEGPRLKITLYKLIALKSFKTSDGRVIDEGECGGFIENVNSMSGRAWVESGAKVWGKGTSLEDDALVKSGCSVISSKMFDTSVVADESTIAFSHLHDNVQVLKDSYVTGSTLKGDSLVAGVFVRKSVLTDQVNIQAVGRRGDSCRVIDSVLSGTGRFSGTINIEGLITELTSFELVNSRYDKIFDTNDSGAFRFTNIYQLDDQGNRIPPVNDSTEATEAPEGPTEGTPAVDPDPEVPDGTSDSDQDAEVSDSESSDADQEAATDASALAAKFNNPDRYKPRR